MRTVIEIPDALWEDLRAAADAHFERSMEAYERAMKAWPEVLAAAMRRGTFADGTPAPHAGMHVSTQRAVQDAQMPRRPSPVTASAALRAALRIGLAALTPEAFERELAQGPRRGRPPLGRVDPRRAPLPRRK